MYANNCPAHANSSLNIQTVAVLIDITVHRGISVQSGMLPVDQCDMHNVLVSDDCRLIKKAAEMYFLPCPIFLTK